MADIKMYYAKNTVALAPCLAIAELGLDIDLIELDFSSAQQRQEDYLKLNPLGRVPLLVTPQGRLSETPAILSYLASMKPEAALMPTDMWQTAKAHSAMSFLASTLHVSWAHRLRGARWTDNPDVIEDLKIKVPENMRDGLRIFKEGHFVGPFVMGKELTVVDFHLFAIASWLKNIEMPLSDFDWLEKQHRLVASRPNLQGLLPSPG